MTELLILGGAAVVGIIVLTLIIAFAFRIVVPTNMVHIVQKAGDSVPYGRNKDAGNVYYAWPAFLPIIGISVIKLPESNFQLNLSDYRAYDIARLPFDIDIAAFFRINDANVAAQRVESFGQLNQQLKAILEGSIRSILARNELEVIMQDRSKFGDEFTDEIDAQLSEWGVSTVKSVEFMDIRDAEGSKVIANIMAKEQSRIQMDSRITVAANLQAAQTKEIEAQRAVDVSAQAAEKEVGVRTAEKTREVGMANEQANQEIQKAAKITAEHTMNVQKVNDVKAAEIQRDTAVIEAEAVKKTTILDAEAAQQETVLKATGDRDAANLDAEGIQAVGMAKAKAEEAMLQAPVTTQINLAQEIGENKRYQEYLISIRTIEAQQEVGIVSAAALKDSDLKIIANSGDVQTGVSNLMDVLSPKGGLSIAGALEALGATEGGKDLVNKFTGGNS